MAKRLREVENVDYPLVQSLADKLFEQRRVWEEGAFAEALRLAYEQVTRSRLPQLRSRENWSRIANWCLDNLTLRSLTMKVWVAEKYHHVSVARAATIANVGYVTEDHLRQVVWLLSAIERSSEDDEEFDDDDCDEDDQDDLDEKDDEKDEAEDDDVL